MRGPAWLAVACVGLVLSAAGAAGAADWDLWADRTQEPPMDQQEWLPIIASGEAIASINVDLGDQTLEKDGQAYKALQWCQDSEFDVTVPVGKYLCGLVGVFFADGTVDPIAFMEAMDLVSIEVDGTVVPMDSSYLLRIDDFPGYETQTLGEYNVWPRFLTLGPHTYVETFAPQEPIFCTIDFAAEGNTDPAPQFEGRRVYVPEQVGDPVDGKIVFRYNLNVVEQPTAVAPLSWAQVKASASSAQQ